MPYVVHQQSGQIAAQTQSCKHTLDHQVGAVLRHRISWDLPSAKPQPIGEIIQAEVRVRAVFQRPGTAGDAAAPVMAPHPFFFWNVHLDGLEYTHDLIVEREGVFKECVLAMKMAKSLGYNVATNTTVYKETDIAEIEALLRGEPRIAPDLKHAHLEDRLIAVGRTAQGRPLFVAFTIRERLGQPTIRPVSARYMHEREAKNYEAQGSKNDH